MKLTEIRKQGYKALIDSLGVVGMLRFIQQFESGYGDYTAEKYQLKVQPGLENFLEQEDEPNLEDFKEFIRQKNQPNQPS